MDVAPAVAIDTAAAVPVSIDVVEPEYVDWISFVVDVVDGEEREVVSRNSHNRYFHASRLYSAAEPIAVAAAYVVAMVVVAPIDSASGDVVAAGASPNRCQ